MDLSGRTALVTGAARGIGRAIALRLAEAGAAVAAADVHPERFEGEPYYRLRRRVSGEEEAVSTAEAIGAAGGRAASFRLDVADPARVEAVCAEVAERLGPVDILVNNAGIVNNIASIEAMTPEAWAHELSVNLSGGFHCARALVPQMARRGWGRVVSIASVGARQPLQGQSAYTASKAGAIGLVQSLAQEFGPRGVTANAILPGLIATPLVLSMPERLRSALLRRVPAQRLGEPREVAELALFLASEPSGYVNGAAIPCDGGLLGAPLEGLS